MLSRPFPRAIPILLEGSNRLGLERIQMRGKGEEDLPCGQGVAVGVVRTVNWQAEAAGKRREVKRLSDRPTATAQ